MIYDQRARYHLPNLTPFNMRRALQNIANSSHKLLPYFYRHLPVLALKLNPPFAQIDCIIIHLTLAPFKENKSKLFLVQRIWQCSIDFWIPSIWFFLPECFSPRFTIGIRCMFFLLEIQWSKIWPISLFRIFTQRDWKRNNTTIWIWQMWTKCSTRNCIISVLFTFGLWCWSLPCWARNAKLRISLVVKAEINSLPP